MSFPVRQGIWHSNKSGKMRSGFVALFSFVQPSLYIEIECVG